MKAEGWTCPRPLKSPRTSIKNFVLLFLAFSRTNQLQTTKYPSLPGVEGSLDQPARFTARDSPTEEEKRIVGGRDSLERDA
jgi:hypothetical protein